MKFWKISKSDLESCSRSSSKILPIFLHFGVLLRIFSNNQVNRVKPEIIKKFLIKTNLSDSSIISSIPSMDLKKSDSVWLIANSIFKRGFELCEKKSFWSAQKFSKSSRKSVKKFGSKMLIKSAPSSALRIVVLGSSKSGKSGKFGFLKLKRL